MAGMFSRVFLKQKRAPADGLVRYFDELVFDGQLHRGEARSRVFVDAAGEVRGFIGVWPRPMLLQGRSIEAAAAGSLMVERSEQHPTAARGCCAAFSPVRRTFRLARRRTTFRSACGRRRAASELTATSVDWLRILRPARPGDAYGRHRVCAG